MPIVVAYRKLVLLPEEFEFIKENYNLMSNRELATHFGLNLKQMRTILYSHGFKRMELEYWTEEQIEYLKQNYKTTGDKELSNYYEKTWPKKKRWVVKHIAKKREFLNLKRTKQELISIRERNVLAGAWLTGKRWNTIGTLEIGTIRLWRYKNTTMFYPVIKTEEGFVFYYRWLWINNIGPLNLDQIVVPKKESSRNRILTIDEIEVIDRAEHVRRNADIWSKTPEELKETIKLINKLSKQLKTKQDE